MTFLEAAKLTNDEAREYMEKLRWPNGPVCPHCESSNHTRLNGSKHRPGTIQCNECREQYTVTVNTVMESSHLPLAKWVLGFHLMCSSKKGISALQLQRELGIGSYRTAWFMEHRIRWAMKVQFGQEKLKGVVEVDETYIGGKPRYKGVTKRGRGSEKKTPVVALVERDGEVRARPVESVDSKTLKAEIRKQVDPSATIMTDELSSYSGIGTEFKGGHHVVKHSEGEYVRKSKGLKVHNNTDESFFALIKRGHYGVYHQMSKRHLHRYADEFSFRWNARSVSDGERREKAIRQAGGKRLMYLTPA